MSVARTSQDIAAKQINFNPEGLDGLRRSATSDHCPTRSTWICDHGVEIL